MVKIKCIYERSTILALNGPEGTTFLCLHWVLPLGGSIWNCSESDQGQAILSAKPEISCLL